MLKRLSSWHSNPVYTVETLRRMETAAAGSLPPHTLMQRAGKAVARLAQARFPHARRIVVLAGTGNNGGDGLIAAVQLRQAGRDVHVLACGAASLDDWISRLPEDAAWAWGEAQAARLPCSAIPQTDALPAADLYLDALLGLGLTGPVREQTATVILALNAQIQTPVLSVDLPSGLDADRGVFHNVCVHATVTLSLLGLKPGACTGPAAPLCGELWSDDLDAVAHTATADVRHTAARLGRDMAGPLLPNLARAAHKGQRGDVRVIGGAAGMTGAALLSARAATRLGAGRVLVGLLDPHAPKVDSFAAELMLRSTNSLLDAPGARGCLLLGPGAGTDARARAALYRALAAPVPLVLDADGLNLLAAAESELHSLLQQRTAPSILTPHPLEAARLLACTVDAVQADRLQAARDLARRYAAWVVLKGRGTVISSPQLNLWINATGNGLLATAGSGDVLAGAIAALISATSNAACVPAAVWLHGRAADLFFAHHGDAGLCAADLPYWIARAWNEVPTPAAPGTMTSYE